MQHGTLFSIDIQYVEMLIADAEAV